MRESQRAIGRAKAAQEHAEKIIRVGSSLLYPCQPFLALGNEKAANPKEFIYKIVSYSDNQLFSVISTLGKDIDFLPRTFDALKAAETASFYKLWDTQLCVAIPKTNSLVSK